MTPERYRKLVNKTAQAVAGITDNNRRSIAGLTPANQYDGKSSATLSETPFSLRGSGYNGLVELSADIQHRTQATVGGKTYSLYPLDSKWTLSSPWLNDDIATAFNSSDPVFLLESNGSLYVAGNVSTTSSIYRLDNGELVEESSGLAQSSFITSDSGDILSTDGSTVRSVLPSEATFATLASSGTSPAIEAAYNYIFVSALTGTSAVFSVIDIRGNVGQYTETQGGTFKGSAVTDTGAVFWFEDAGAWTFYYVGEGGVLSSRTISAALLATQNIGAGEEDSAIAIYPYQNDKFKVLYTNDVADASGGYSLRSQTLKFTTDWVWMGEEELAYYTSPIEANGSFSSPDQSKMGATLFLEIDGEIKTVDACYVPASILMYSSTSSGGGGDTPNLQEVTDAGNTTDNVLHVYSESQATDYAELRSSGVWFNQGTSHLAPIQNGLQDLYLGGTSQESADWSSVNVYTDGTDDLLWNDQIIGTQDWATTNFEQLVNKGQANGYVPLDSSSLIPSQYMPPLVVVDTFVVASEAAMLALSSAEQGDIAVRTDVSKTFILTNNDPTSVGNWQELLSPSGGVTSVNGLSGPVQLDLSFTPSTGLLGLTGSSDVDLGFTSTDTANWDAAYSWGNHSSQGYATQSWVNSQEYATQTWVNAQGFVDENLSSLSFNISDGVLTASLSSGTQTTVDLDGRYLQSASLSDLTDVNETTGSGLQDGAVLQYSSVAAKWIPVKELDLNIEGGDLTADNAPAAGQVYQYNGSTFQWATVTSGGVTSLNDIGDVSVPSPNNGDVLSWNGSTWVASAAGGGSADGVVNNALFSGGTLTLERSLGLSDVTVNLDGRYLQSYTETDPTGVASLSFSGTTTKTLTVTLNNGSTRTATFTDLQGGGGSVSDGVVNGASFNTSNGVLTLNRTESLPDVTVDLDGRYLTSAMQSFLVVADSQAGGSTITNGDFLSLVGGTGIETARTGTTGVSTVTFNLEDGGVTTAKIADGAVTTAKIPDGAVAESKLDIANSPSTDRVLAYNDSGEMEWRSPSDTTAIKAAEAWSSSIQSISVSSSSWARVENYTTIEQYAPSTLLTENAFQDGEFSITHGGVYEITYRIRLGLTTQGNSYQAGVSINGAAPSEKTTSDSKDGVGNLQMTFLTVLNTLDYFELQLLSTKTETINTNKVYLSVKRLSDFI